MKKGYIEDDFVSFGKYKKYRGIGYKKKIRNSYFLNANKPNQKSLSPPFNTIIVTITGN